jgi:xanthine dehydrogenase accessory factor
VRTRPLVVIRGGGDLGTGVAHELHRAGYAVAVLETERPRAVRRAAAFAEAVYAGRTTVEGVEAVLVRPAEVAGAVGAAAVPVVVDPDGALVRALEPAAVVDARMAKRNLGTSRADASVTIAPGPGFEAGRDVDIVIETNRGPSLGRIIERGAAEPNTGVPGEVGGAAAERVLRAPAAGEFAAVGRIGDVVREGAVVGSVGGADVTARIPGLLRGLAADGLRVEAGEKVGDVDPRGREVDPAAISDKARAVGRAVLAALRARGVQPGGR